MAVYTPNTNWDDINARGGVSGTTQAPTLAPASDPNTETTNTDWSQVLPRGGVSGTTTPQTPTVDRGGIASAYQKYLGRAINPDEYQYWQNTPNYEQAIAGSAEAQQYANSPKPFDPYNGDPWFQQNPFPDGGSYEQQQAWQREAAKRGRTASGSANSTSPAGSMPWVQQQLARYKSTDDPNYWVRVMAADPKVAAGDQSAIDYWLMRMSIGDGAEDVRMGRKSPYDHGGGASGGFGGGSNNGTAFSDPATQQWETMLRQVADRLMNPTPDATKELQQTQALDPLERQRQTMKQQTAQRLSQRGITPTSGTWDEAMREVDRQFNELRTRTQAGFANTFAQNDENRMMQATNLFKQIPQYQDTRLELARNTLIPTNVGSLLTLQQQGNQWDSQQQQAFWTNLANAVSQLLQNR
jgi:hypothetical protein